MSSGMVRARGEDGFGAQIVARGQQACELAVVEQPGRGLAPADHIDVRRAQKPFPSASWAPPSGNLVQFVLLFGTSVARDVGGARVVVSAIYDPA